MSASGDEESTPNDPDSRVSPAIDWAVATEVGEGIGPDSGAEGGGTAHQATIETLATCEAQAAGEALVTVEAQAAGEAQATIETLAACEAQAAGEALVTIEAQATIETLATCEAQAAGEAQVIEIGVAEEVVGPETSSHSFSSSPSIEPAEEEEEEEEAGDRVPQRLVDARQFPLMNFRFAFLDLVNSLLQRMYHRDDLLIRPYWDHQLLRSRAALSSSSSSPSASPSPSPDPRPGPSELQLLHMPLRSRVGAPRQGEGEGEGEEEEAVVSIPELEDPTGCCNPTAVLTLTSALPEPAKETAQRAKSGEQKVDSEGEEWIEASQTRFENRKDDDEDVGSEKEKKAEEKSEKETETQEEPEKDPDPAGGSPGKPSASED